MTMSTLTHARCFNHSHREASARCPDCGRTFCRECVTEHEGRVFCTPCLAALSTKPVRSRNRLCGILNGAWGLLSTLLLWAVFYYLGSALQTIPTKLHESFSW